MKFDIALTFVAAAYAVELRDSRPPPPPPPPFPETIEEIKALPFLYLPIDASRDCIYFEIDEMARHTGRLTAEEVDRAKQDAWNAIDDGYTTVWLWTRFFLRPLVAETADFPSDDMLQEASDAHLLNIWDCIWDKGP